MSTKLTKRPSSKRKKHPKNTSKFEVLTQLGLESFYPSQLEPSSILDLNTWTLENLIARKANDLPKCFLQKLWLLNPDARSTNCKAQSEVPENPNEKTVHFIGRNSCTIHPLDLVTAVYQCSNTFLQQEMTARMLQCHFAVPLLLPYIHEEEEASSFLLWPLRGLVRPWNFQSVDGNPQIQEAVLASTSMPIISCIRLGSCHISKSEVLNNIIGRETFVHGGMEGGRLLRSLSDGLVEIAWYFPIGDPGEDKFPVPVVFFNLRGDAVAHEKCLSFLGKASSVVIILCENPKAREKQLLISCKDWNAKVIVIDFSEIKSAEEEGISSPRNLQEELGLPVGSVIPGTGLSPDNLANVLSQTVKDLLPDLKLSSLEGVAKLATEQGFDCDEGAVCKKTMNIAELVLKGFHEGSSVFREKQLPLQGLPWKRLAEIDKEEARNRKELKELDSRSQNEKKNLLANLNKYKFTSSMKSFTSAVSSTDKVERMYFLTWMKVKLRLLQRQKEMELKDLLINRQTGRNNSIPQQSELENGDNDVWVDNASFCTDSTFEDEDEQFMDSDHDVIDLGNEVGLSVGQNEGSGYLLGQYIDSNVTRENGTEDESRDHDFLEGQTGQEVFVAGQGRSSIHSCLLRIGRRKENEMDVPPLEMDLQSFQQENQEEMDSLQDRNGFSRNEKQVFGEGILEADSTLNSAVMAHEKVVKNNFPIENNEESEGLQKALFDPINPAEFAGEDILQNDVSFNQKLVENINNSEIPLNEEGLKHIFPNKEESGTPPNPHLDSLNQEQIPKLVENISLKPEVALNIPENNSTKSPLRETTSLKVPGPSPKGKTTKPEPPFLLGLEHFFREMGLIFELTHTNPGSENHNEWRLPSIAADLILNGVPLELMDGDASNIPMRWLCSVLTEIQLRFPRERFGTLASLGAHRARNAEILSGLFGTKFPDERQRSTRGVYMAALPLPTKLKKKINFDFLLLLDVEGLCCPSSDGQIKPISDHEMATLASGVSDVLLQNLYSCSASELETSLTVSVNALLRIREYGSVPICRILIQDEGINTLLEATQLKRVSKILQTKTGPQRLTDTILTNPNSKPKQSVLYLQPWYNEALSKSIDGQHSDAMLKLKRSLFGGLKEASVYSETCGLPEFLGRLHSVWEAVKADSYSVSPEKKDIALGFSMFCTELSKWEESLLDNVECWLTKATQTISSTEPEALDPSIQNDFLCELQYDAKREIKKEVNKLKLNSKASLKENKLDVYIKSLNAVLLRYTTELEEQITAVTMARLEIINERHFTSTQFNRIETILETEQNARLEVLLDDSASKNQLLYDRDLEEEFEAVWKEALSKMDFRPSEMDDITERVKNILLENIVKHGLQKHFYKLLDFGQNQTTHFHVDDQYFGYNSRMKNLFENQNKSPKAKAQQLSSNIMDFYQKFVMEKVSLPQDFSDSYITELLEKIDQTLEEAQLEIRTAFQVDLKVFVCNAASKDFQRVHNRFAKDGELLKSFQAKKKAFMAEFMYQFRKKDQRQRLAQRFLTDIIQPTVMDYIYRPLGMQISEEIQRKSLQYNSPQTFHQTLLENLIHEDKFESFTEYLFSYDQFKMREIQETVMAYLSDWNAKTWTNQRLGEIIGKVAAAMSQVVKSTSEVLSDTKPLLEQVCLNLEDKEVQTPWESLKGPTYSITTEWDGFVTCFLELLAGLRLDLAQNFSQDLKMDQFLELLPIQPKDCLYLKVQGCEARCPLCGEPCGVEDIGNHVHETSFHRPKSLLEPPSQITPEAAILDGFDVQGHAVACWELQSFHPDWNLSPEETNGRTPCLYWRYVLARFNERFAVKSNQNPAKIPEEWKEITTEDVLVNLRDVFIPSGHS
ncbi:interferon-induced very large GTPase 1 [Stigmatopora nigra]